RVSLYEQIPVLSGLSHKIRSRLQGAGQSASAGSGDRNGIDQIAKSQRRSLKSHRRSRTDSDSLLTDWRKGQAGRVCPFKRGNEQIEIGAAGAVQSCGDGNSGGQVGEGKEGCYGLRVETVSDARLSESHPRTRNGVQRSSGAGSPLHCNDDQLRA